MKQVLAVGAVLFIIALVAVVQSSSMLSSPIIPAAYSALPSGGFAVREPVEYGGAIRGVGEERGFIGRAIEVDTNMCWKCTFDGKSVGYSAEQMESAMRACDELGGKLVFWHDGSCSNVETIAR